VNGPFMLDAWTPASLQCCASYPQHYAAATIALDGVEYFPIEERRRTSRVTARGSCR
jgi:hypothetical protein